MPRTSTQARPGSRRPQQPANSPAASLPAELVAKVLEQGTASESPERAQAFSLAFGAVCSQWCAVALPLRRYFAAGSARAHELAQVLKSLGASGASRVKELVIVVEKKGKTRGPRVAELLQLCPNLLHLDLTVRKSLSAKAHRQRDGTFGLGVREALKGLPKLRTVKLRGQIKGTAKMWDQSIFKYWPDLETLDAMSIRMRRDTSPGGDPADAHLPTKLRHLALTAYDAKLLAENLVKASSATLRSLDLGQIPPTWTGGAAIIAEPVLNRLHVLAARDAVVVRSMLGGVGSAMESALRRLGSIRTLQLGVHLVHFPQLFSILSSLSTLQHVELLLDHDTLAGCWQDLQAVDVATHFLTLGDGQLESWKVPRELVSDWSREERDMVKEAARMAAIKWTVKRS